MVRGYQRTPSSAVSARNHAQFRHNASMRPEEIRVSVTSAPDGATIARWRAMRPRGQATALTPGQGWDEGATAANAAIDAGAGVLMLVDETSPSVTARAITALYCGLDASQVVDTRSSDLARMEATRAVRDAMPMVRSLVTDTLALLEHDGHLAWHTSVIAHAAMRRTPVVIAGTLPHIAALAAQRVGTACASWVEWGIASEDAAATAARTRLARTPWVSSNIPLSTETMASLLVAAIADLDG